MILYLNEYIRVQHTTQHRDGTVSVDYMSSNAGKELKKKLDEFGIDRKLVETDYIYPHIPEPKNVDNRGTPISYNDPKQKEVKPYYEQMTNKIIESKPDIVIPNGKLGCKFLLGTVSITKLRGKPEQVTLENEMGSHTFWVLPMFSMEYVTFQPSNLHYLENDLSLLKSYLDKGDKAFIPDPVTYDFVDTIEGVREVFKTIEDKRTTVAWDLETNTLTPEVDGAKALLMSLSWQENSGVSIPLEHKEFTWEQSEFEEILGYIKEFVKTTDYYKVGHNIKYDIRFLMTVYNMTEFNNHLDTRVAYFLVVNQENTGDKTLSGISYELTDMGGYDKPLDDYKNKYIQDYKKEHGKSKKPVNEVDGSDFNYEWIPLEILHPYASGDVDATLRIHNELLNRMQGQFNWENLYTQFYPRLTRSLARMEANGMPLDDDYRHLLYDKYEEELERLIGELRKLPSIQELEDLHRAYYEEGLEEWKKPKAERDEAVAKLRDKYKKKLEFNPRSPDDKGKLLFDLLNIKPPINKEYVKDKAMQKNPKTHDDLNWSDYSTSKDVLKYIVDEYENMERGEEAKEVAEQLLGYSQIATLQGYAKSYIPDQHGKLHGNFNIVGTASTRLSSSSPK